MFKPPHTLAEAKERRYGEWAGMPRGVRYNPKCCAYEVPDGPMSPLFRQCARKPGKGPEELYCAQHAKLIGGRR